MTVEEAVDVIFQRLCGHLKTGAEQTDMSRGPLGSGMPEEIFTAALRQLRGPANDQDLYIEFIGGNPDRIRLGASWRGRCEDVK